MPRYRVIYQHPTQADPQETEGSAPNLLMLLGKAESQGIHHSMIQLVQVVPERRIVIPGRKN